MNFIPKNPNDPKYQEFHDGEYEFWPMDDTIKTKSISIPAAVVSGLELLAAVAAAGLLAVALAVMYVTTSPLMIRHNSALINTNVYNNNENQRIIYTLSIPENPENILYEGTLEDNEETLDLKNLLSGTEYLLLFYDSDGNEIGRSQFSTLGQPGQQEVPKPGGQDSLPVTPDEPTTEPADMPGETEASTEPESETVPETEPEMETEPEEEFFPGIGGGDDTPNDPPAPDPEPEPEPEETEPEPTEPPMQAFSPEIEEINYTDPYDPEDSGNTDDAYFEITEVYVFIDVPADHTVTVLQNGKTQENIRSNYSDDGTLTVTVYGNPVHYGETMKTSVAVESGKNRIEQGSTFTPPYLMKDATLNMTEEAADNSTTYTFTITAHTRDDSNEKMVCEAELYTMLGDDYVLVPLSEASPGMYVGTYRVTTTAWPVENPFAIIRGYWDKTSEGKYYQETLAVYDPA